MVLHAQDIADQFNRANSNTVGGGWTETETGAGGASIAANMLHLQETSNATGRQYVSRTTPGSYNTTLNQNGCTMTWAFNMRQSESQSELSGFDSGDDGVAVVLAGSSATLTTGTGYAVVLGQAGNTDRLRLVRYNGGLDADANLTDIIATSDFDNDYLDVRVTYEPSTDTWSLFYRNNGNTLFSDPLTAGTAGGSAVDNTYTGTSLPIIGALWNHDGDNGEDADIDNFFIPGGLPTVPTMSPSAPTICGGSGQSITASASSSTLTRVTFSSSGGPSTVSTSGANNGSVYPWTVNVSGVPASGVVVESVTLNGVTHTYPDDLDILLQSPTGTNVILMSDAGGDPNISGNTYTFMDDSPAMSDAGINNSGMYRPTNYGTPDDWPTAPGPGSFTQATPTLALFGGDLNGDWDLLIRDDANIDGGQVGSWSITLTYTSTVAYTWAPATGLSATMGATVTASPTSTQAYTVTASHSGNGCTSVGNVTVTVVDPPTTATVGGPQTVCELGTTTGLGGNTPGVGTGAWSVVSGGTGTFSSNTDPDATFTHTGGAGPVVVRWTISTSSPCPPSTADVSITITPTPTTATVGGSQTICEGGTTVGLGGNTPVNGTGAWTVVSGGTGSFSNAADPNATFTHAAGAGPVVVRWTISNAPCTPSTADVSITITPSPTTSAAGSDQSICNQPGTATMAANAPGIGTGVWSQVSGPAATITTPASPTTTITGMTTPGSYVFRWTISNAPCTASEDDVTITTAVCAYYSRATGNVTDPIWSDTPTGTAGAATFGSTVSMVVQSPDVVTNDANTTVNDLTVDAGGELVLAGSVFLAADGDAVDINGDLTANDNSLLVLSPSVASTFDLTNATSLWDLTIDADVSTTLTGALSIRGSLDLLDGDFDCTANQVTLASGVGYTGRLGPVAATADYLGNMRIERYRPAGLTNWMLLGSPLQSRTVNHWQDDFITAGYPGSQFPNFDDPVGSNILWPSIRWYDETNTGAGSNDGLQGVSSNAQPLTIGQGFAVWAGSGLVNTSAFQVDLQNNVPVIASTPVTLPMSYTNTGNASVDGWNLVSNPLPSPIAFDQIVRGADVGDFVTFYNPANGNTAVWDISLNAGTNGGTNTIQSMQGFFLKATGSLVTTTVDESAKVNDNAGGMFGLTGEPAAHLRLRIASDLNTFSDEAIVVFSEGQPALDADDAEKFVLAHDAAPQIATLSDGIQLAMNAYGNADAGASLPLRVNVGVTGEHTISAIEVGGLDLSCLAIEDLETGAMVSLLGGQGYTFTMDAAADPAIARFILHINNGPVASFTADNSTVTVGQPVQFTAAGTTGSYAWSFGDGNLSTVQNPQHAYAAAGIYTVTLTTDDGVCSSSASDEVTVELSTSVAAATKAEHRAWATPQGIVVEHAFTGKAAVTVELLDATGRVAFTGRMHASRQVLPSDQLANGAWFVRLDNGTERVTLRVPLAR